MRARLVYTARRIVGMGAEDLLLAIEHGVQQSLDPSPAIARKVRILMLTSTVKIAVGSALGRLVGWPTEPKEALQPPPKAEE